jgi:tetratricopeptide (TPR) repeat protein
LLIYLAEAKNKLGEVDVVEKLCEQVFAILSDRHDDFVFARALHLRGITSGARGKFDLAVGDLEEARKKFENLGFYRNTAYVTGDLGIVYYYQNQFEAAVENYRRALAACEQVHDMRGVMLGHFNIGDVLLQQGHYEQACQELSAALSLAHKNKLVRAEINSGLYLADAQIGCKLYEQAKKGLDALDALISSDGSPVFAGQAYRLQAGLAWRQGSFELAKENFERAFALLQGADEEYEMARAHFDRALFLQQIGQYEPARAALNEARKGFKSLNSQLGLQSVEKAFAELNNQQA